MINPSVCASVCPRAYLWNRWTDRHEILCRSPVAVAQSSSDGVALSVRFVGGGETGVGWFNPHWLKMTPTLVTDNFCLGSRRVRGRDRKRKGREKRREGEGKDPYCFWTNRTLVALSYVLPVICMTSFLAVMGARQTRVGSTQRR